jgi:hypothetical protein
VPREYGTLEYGAGFFGVAERNGSGQGEDRETSTSQATRIREAGGVGEDRETTTSSALRVRIVSLNPAKDKESGTLGTASRFRPGKGIAKDREVTTSSAFRVRFGYEATGVDQDVGRTPLLSKDIQNRLNKLTDRLPPWMPGRDSSNESLLAPIAREIKATDKDLEHVYNVSKLQLAPTDVDVEKHASFVDINRTTNNREVIRAKTQLGFAMNTSQGTVYQMIRAASLLLDVDPSDIDYSEPNTGGGIIDMRFPESVIEDSEIPRSNFLKLMTEFSAAGFGVQIVWKSTFEHKTLEEYNNGELKPERGYNTLDTDGNIVESGGTYTSLDTYD